MPSLQVDIERLALELGFEAVGFAPPNLPEPDQNHYLNWLHQGHAADLWYMQETSRVEKRLDPKKLFPEVKTVVVFALSYAPKHPTPPDPKMARYAWGKDYHVVIKEKLLKLVKALEPNHPHLKTKICVDTAPVLERSFAQMAALGWIGKNTCLINKTLGSYIFLSELLINHEITQNTAPVFDHCGSCTACLEACPTQAFEAPHVLNASKCISYQTLENKNETLPLAFDLHGWVAGCDVCQEVCPWNTKAPPTHEKQFAPLPHTTLNTQKLMGLSETQHAQFFKDTALERISYKNLKRNLSHLVHLNKNKA